MTHTPYERMKVESHVLNLRGVMAVCYAPFTTHWTVRDLAAIHSTQPLLIPGRAKQWHNSGESEGGGREGIRGYTISTTPRGTREAGPMCTIGAPGCWEMPPLT